MTHIYQSGRYYVIPIPTGFTIYHDGKPQHTIHRLGHIGLELARAECDRLAAKHPDTL